MCENVFCTLCLKAPFMQKNETGGRLILSAFHTDNNLQKNTPLYSVHYDLDKSVSSLNGRPKQGSPFGSSEIGWSLGERESSEPGSSLG